MARPVANFPRIISPDNVEVGDKIRAEFVPVNGRKIMYEGIVSRIDGAGRLRAFYTDEGACLVSVGRKGRIILLDRPAAQQTALFELDSEIERRISANG